MRPLKRLVVTFFLLTVVVSSAYGGCSDPQQFWRRFRQAVLDNDVKAIMTLTYFPLEGRGVDDSIPIQRYDRKAFQKTYKKLINQPVLLPSGGRVVSKTMFELIREKKTIVSKDFNTADYLQIYDFEFKLVNGCWFFTSVDLED